MDEEKELTQPQALTAEDFLAAQQSVSLRAIKVPAPEMGEGRFVFVAELSADERDELEVEWSKYRDDDSIVGIRGFYAAFAVCDGERKRLYRTSEELANAAHVFSAIIHGRFVSRVFNRFTKLNGILQSDIDELEKNSPSDPKESGNGGSRLVSDSPAAKRGSKKSRAKSTENSEHLPGSNA